VTVWPIATLSPQKLWQLVPCTVFLVHVIPTKDANKCQAENPHICEDNCTPALEKCWVMYSKKKLFPGVGEWIRIKYAACGPKKNPTLKTTGHRNRNDCEKNAENSNKKKLQKVRIQLSLVLNVCTFKQLLTFRPNLATRDGWTNCHKAVYYLHLWQLVHISPGVNKKVVGPHTCYRAWTDEGREIQESNCHKAKCAIVARQR
jgi:hypothetical protein